MFAEHILPLITPVDELWQPTDFLPDSSADSDQFYQEVRVLGMCLADALMGCAKVWMGQAEARLPTALHAPYLLPFPTPAPPPRPP
jgi:hypothetical protein